MGTQLRIETPSPIPGGLNSQSRPPNPQLMGPYLAVEVTHPQLVGPQFTVEAPNPKPWPPAHSIGPPVYSQSEYTEFIETMMKIHTFLFLYRNWIKGEELGKVLIYK